MAYSAETFECAREIIEKRRKEAEDALEARMKLLAKIDPEYSDCIHTILTTGAELVACLSMPEEKADKKIKELEKKNLEAQKRLPEILKKNKLTPDYLEVKYFCPDCQDTGANGTKPCHCMIDVLKKLTIDDEAKRSPLKFCRFEDFRLDYYPDEKLPELNGKSPRQRMSEIFEYCKTYAAAFDTDAEGICMYGETGLGKTHLSLAIAAEVIEKGYSVVYNSAQNILNKLNQIQFGRLDDKTYEPMLLECDLLVIDDLGAEFRTPFTQSAVYNIINTRMNSGLPTIISTNIGLDELAEYYGKRVASRIIGDYQLLKFVGEDIRQKRRNEM